MEKMKQCKSIETSLNTFQEEISKYANHSSSSMVQMSKVVSSIKASSESQLAPILDLVL